MVVGYVEGAAGLGTGRGCGVWGGGFAEDENFDEDADKDYYSQLAEEETLRKGPPG